MTLWVKDARGRGREPGSPSPSSKPVLQKDNSACLNAWKPPLITPRQERLRRPLSCPDSVTNHKSQHHFPAVENKMQLEGSSGRRRARPKGCLTLFVLPRG